MVCDFYPVTDPKIYGNPNTDFGLAISVPEIVIIIWTISLILEKYKRVKQKNQRPLFLLSCLVNFCFILFFEVRTI